ncbi:hypothetical protein L1987_23064 [Smallanthus sonchifolius]|uniref:Uncharacterized protein n=1 Tax=Smallanthus sonchifolius TaxID=185202 RepID=A0ACB9IIB7_9ASTR|nr:hypothetical protein L1987_23064 [Smallanthus sonchifolius]
MDQIPTHRRYLAHEAPFQSFSPAFVSGGPFLSEPTGFSAFSPTIDVDGSLSDAFSVLNLSPVTYADPPPEFFQNTFAGQIGSSAGAGDGGDGGEGFFHSFNSPHVGVNSFLNQQRWSGDMEFLRRQSSYGFDFDQKSNLDSKKLLYFTPQSSHIDPEIADKKLKFQRLDDYEQQNPCSCSKFQNQNQNQSQSQQSQYMSLWDLRELKEGIYRMAKDQNGCRILQAMLERATMEEVEVVLSEVVNFISELMKDQFGNYLVQKLVVMCNNDKKMRLILSLTEVPTEIILVCMNPHGTRAVQKLLENLNPGQVKLVMKALYRGAATLAVDPNGHHVIQYCLATFDSDINKPILTEIANECYRIATDRSGCCVVQACVEHSRGEVRRRLIAEIMVNSIHLAEDPFGNYVLQHIVGLNKPEPELTALLVRQLKGNFASLSCNKYASNVVEKCLNETGEEISTSIIMELVTSPKSSLLLVDPYANFVIQSALRVSKGFAYDCLCNLISKNMLSMRTNLYGKKILERLEKKRVNFA